jgi:copper chaperone CopZ
MMKKLAALQLIALLSICGFFSVAAQAESLSTEATSLSAQEGEKQAHYDKNALRRLDLRVVGKSCPVCLLGIERRVRSLPGVVKAAVMLKKPWCASVIYDSKRVQQAKIVQTITSYERNTSVSDIEDEPVAKVPLILIPRRPSIVPQATSLK